MSAREKNAATGKLPCGISSRPDHRRLTDALLQEYELAEEEVNISLDRFRDEYCNPDGSVKYVPSNIQNKVVTNGRFFRLFLFLFISQVHFQNTRL